MSRFNSTLVRFKLEFASNAMRVKPGFQFHSGSIQTLPLLEQGTWPETFQFHSGSIQTFHSLIQIMRTPTVSIPLWFDSNETCFSGGKVSSLSFQFHSGSIQTCRSMMKTAILLQVSIPLWFDSNLTAGVVVLTR